MGEQQPFLPWVFVTGHCHQGRPSFCQEGPSGPQPFHELGQGRGSSWKSSPGLGSAISIQVGQERPIPSEGHGGGSHTHPPPWHRQPVSCHPALPCHAPHPQPCHPASLGTRMHFWVLPLCINHFDWCHSLRCMLKFHSYVCRSRWQLGRL